MPRQLVAKLFNKSKGTEISVCADIADDDWNRLIVYADEVVALEESGVLEHGLHASCTLRWDAATNQLQCQGTLPQDVYIAALLHRMRPFVLNDEATYFYKTCKILCRYVDNQDFRALIESQRDLYSGKDFQRQVRIDWKSESFAAVVNSDETLKKWLNVVEYHRDPKKKSKSEIDDLHRLLPQAATRAIFVSMLLDKTKAIRNLAIVIRLLERGDVIPLSA